tara:strand:+ start:315 stop:875 length:561 start_codon:yes stop_codon:yes gene_type:complete
MRIIAGDFKGKKIIFPLDKNTRPLRDMVKEAIFNLIENSNKFDLRLNESCILDLFSGSGSFGLECLSRGAKEVFFFENYSKTLKILKKNISDLKLSQKCKVFEENCFNFFKEENKIDKKFKVIFIDPPFKEKNINSLINLILKKKILSENGIIIIHRHKKDELIITNQLKIIVNRLYGISKIIIGN